MDRVRVGIVGCGAFAKGQYFPNCAANPKVDITWACSRSEENRKWVSDRYDVKHLTPRAADVFAADDVDVAILAVPHDLHEEMVAAAAAAGKHIMCEKPMAMSIDESYRIVRAVQKAGVRLCVDYNRRFGPAMVDLKQRYLKQRRNPVMPAWKLDVAPDRRRLPEEDCSMFSVRINDESSTYRPVHIDWQTGGGAIIGETCHWLDLCCWLFDETPYRVWATGSSRINHIITLDFPSGHRACIFFSSNGTFDYPKELYELQDHGVLWRSHCFVENEAYGLPEPYRKTFPFQFDECTEIEPQEGLDAYVNKLAYRSKVWGESGGKQYPELAPDKGHYNLLAAYMDAILTDGPSPVSEVDGSLATYLSCRAIESIRLGQPLPVRAEDYDFFVN